MPPRNYQRYSKHLKMMRVIFFSAATHWHIALEASADKVMVGLGSDFCICEFYTTQLAPETLRRNWFSVNKSTIWMRLYQCFTLLSHRDFNFNEHRKVWFQKKSTAKNRYLLCQVFICFFRRNPRHMKSINNTDAREKAKKCWLHSPYWASQYQTNRIFRRKWAAPPPNNVAFETAQIFIFIIHKSKHRPKRA